MAVRPPHFAEEWSIWQDACIQANRRDLLPQDLRVRRWPEGFPSGIGWTPVAQDHPFTGSHFCWRCVAEASGLAGCEVVPHRRARHVICWGPAEGDTDAEDGQPDPGPSVEVTTPGVRTVEGSSIRVQKLDPSGRPIGPAQDLGSAFVHFEAEEPDLADTGTLFVNTTRLRSVSVALSPEAVERIAWVHATLEAQHDFRDSWPPSWTDDAPAAEPIPALEPQRPALNPAQPVEAHSAEDEDWQPGTDAEA